MTKTFVCFRKHLSGVFYIERPLLKRLRVPLASRHGEEVATVDVERCCDPIERIRHGVDYRFTERNRFFEAERLYAV